VERKRLVEIVGEHEMEDFESWRGVFEPQPRSWEADAGDVPVSPLDWDHVVDWMIMMRNWRDIGTTLLFS
jgi:hypothetical protein